MSPPWAVDLQRKVCSDSYIDCAVQAVVVLPYGYCCSHSWFSLGSLQYLVVSAVTQSEAPVEHRKERKTIVPANASSHQLPRPAEFNFQRVNNPGRKIRTARNEGQESIEELVLFSLFVISTYILPLCRVPPRRPPTLKSTVTTCPALFNRARTLHGLPISSCNTTSGRSTAVSAPPPLSLALSLTLPWYRSLHIRGRGGSTGKHLHYSLPLYCCRVNC